MFDFLAVFHFILNTDATGTMALFCHNTSLVYQKHFYIFKPGCFSWINAYDYSLDKLADSGDTGCIQK